MDIVLNKEDLEKLVRHSYQGVKEVKFNTKTPKVTLTVDLDNFTSLTNEKKTPKKREPKASPVVDDKKDIEEREKERRKQLEAKGAIMASGGKERNRSMKRF